MKPNRVNIILLFLVLLSSACDERRQRGAYDTNPTKELVVGGLRHPWSICFLSEDEALISEKDGVLLAVNLLTKEKNEVAGFPGDLVDSIRLKDGRDNSGIFEIVKHPDFDNTRWIYVSYAVESAQGTTTKIIRAELQSDSLTNVTDLFVATPFRQDLFHYGGGMTFGDDGKLYFTIGERYYNEVDQPLIPVAQDVSDKRGKIYRLNDDGSIPEDNPDFGEDAIPGIYALGIRAAQGITLDERTGNIWFSEHGSTQGDELNLLKPGANYGWPIRTSGKYRNREYIPPKAEGTTFTGPKHFWLQTIAPTGLVVYYGEEFPSWNGNILLAGLSIGSLWRIRLEDTVPTSLEELFVDDRVRLRKVALSPGGRLYLLTDEPEGQLIRIKNSRNE